MNSNSDNQARNTHPLADIQSISTSFVNALKEHWIETAEQALAMSAMPDSRSGLKTLLSCSDNELDAFLSVLKEVVGQKETSQLATPKAGGQCGVVLTEEQKQRFGLK